MTLEQTVAVQEGPRVLVQCIATKIKLRAVAGNLRNDLHEVCQALTFQGKAIRIDFGHSL